MIKLESTQEAEYKHELEHWKVEMECHGDTQKEIGGRWNGRKLGLEEVPIRRSMLCSLMRF